MLLSCSSIVIDAAFMVLYTDSHENKGEGQTFKVIDAHIRLAE